nr:RDD family protein [Tamlana nanhaiensis]
MPLSAFQFASIFDRVKAAFIDTVILILMMYVFSLIFDSFEPVSEIIKITIYILLFILYDPLLTALKGGTIGHSILKLGVRKDENYDEKGKRIPFLIAIIRFILKGTLGWVSLLTISGDKKKKSIHDKAAKSVVIKLNK